MAHTIDMGEARLFGVHRHRGAVWQPDSTLRHLSSQQLELLVALLRSIIAATPLLPSIRIATAASLLPSVRAVLAPTLLRRIAPATTLLQSRPAGLLTSVAGAAAPALLRSMLATLLPAVSRATATAPAPAMLWCVTTATATAALLRCIAATAALRVSLRRTVAECQPQMKRASHAPSLYSSTRPGRHFLGAALVDI